ncbi:MAG TPA: AtpZ/AtpI family protein [Abditibacterium sp.]|jgi:F0F1-type ATP synthase assembly protein I
MSSRDEEPKPSPLPRPGFLGRTKAMSSGGSTGWEATTIGFTLVGCIAACSALGYWLDNRFETGYFLPILFLVGVIAGFREMFLVLGRISKEQEKAKREKQAKVAANPSHAPQIDLQVAPPERERIFKVPPPPVAGQKIAETEKTPESVDELIERLMEDEKDENIGDQTQR